MAPLMTDDVPALIDANAAHIQPKIQIHQLQIQLQLQIQVQRACPQTDKYAKSI